MTEDELYLNDSLALVGTHVADVQGLTFEKALGY